jgi:hypothetical protein
MEVVKETTPVRSTEELSPTRLGLPHVTTVPSFMSAANEPPCARWLVEINTTPPVKFTAELSPP